MNIYRLTTERDREGHWRYRWLLEADEDNRSKIDEYRSRYNLFRGQSVSEFWQPIEVVPEDRETYQWQSTPPLGDFPCLTSAGIEPVFSRLAVDALSNLLEGNGELLPLNCAEGEYYLFNTTRIVDALDEEKTEFKPYSEVDPDMAYQDDDPHAPVITRPAFYPEVVADLTIFKIPLRYPFGGTLVTDKFVQRVQETELTGFAFELLWSR
jgi:hypothetical protein